jgi:hypothetical protein
MKIESHDVIFLEKVFPKTGEVEKDFQLYEMENLDYGTISHSIEDLDEILLEIVGEIFYLFLLLWSKIMSNLNLIETFVNQFLVVNLRLRGKHS